MQSHQSSLLKRFDNLLHAFSTREEGFSEKPYSGNNLAYHVNDNPVNVDRNHLAYSEYLNYPLKNLVRMDQIHGDTIRIIEKDSDLTRVSQCDALITNLKETPLMVMVADCLPILIFDPLNRAIAAIHAGRAGIFSQIVPKCIQQMQNRYNSRAEELIVVVGPSIHKCCYEVGKEVVQQTKASGYDFSLKQTDGTYYLDLITILNRQLQSSKVKDRNIEVSPYCTSCNNDIFYSYRAENSTCGRFSGLIMLK